ncbi:MAG: hypothetical protein Q8Q29_02325 [Actinomycetota bacterium]|nr:hypothetical protein [Actinomycetota bacterium]
MSWKPLGAVSPTRLVDARLQLHHAAQVVASAGITLFAPAPDDSHPNFGWVESLGALMGHSLPGADAQVGLRVADLSLLLVNRSGEVSDEFALDGRKLDDGYAWLAGATAGAGAKLPAAGVTRAAYEIPNHPTGNGERCHRARRRPGQEHRARSFARRRWLRRALLVRLTLALSRAERVARARGRRALAHGGVHLGHSHGLGPRRRLTGKPE